LAASLVDALEDWENRHTHEPNGSVAKVPKTFLRIMNDDLVAAGLARRVPLDVDGEEIPLDEKGHPVAKPEKWIINKRDAAGRVLDLHALRHTYGSRLVAAGVDIKTVQTLMRHSSPELTLGIYIHTDKQRLKDAVEALPDVDSRPSTNRKAKGA